MSRWVCIKEGCNRGPGGTGGALHRLSPKGELFKGVCTEHAPEYSVRVEPIAVAIEKENNK